MPKVLVTGGGGVIGAKLVRHPLAAAPPTPPRTIACPAHPGNHAHPSGGARHPRYTFIKGDITDREQVRAAMRLGVTDVINFAAESHVDRSIQDSGPFVRTNVLGTQVLLDAAREFKVERYGQVSTLE